MPSFSSVTCQSQIARIATGLLVEGVRCRLDRDSLAAAAVLRSLLEELSAQPDFSCLPALNLVEGQRGLNLESITTIVPPCYLLEFSGETTKHLAETVCVHLLHSSGHLLLAVDP